MSCDIVIIVSRSAVSRKSGGAGGVVSDGGTKELIQQHITSRHKTYVRPTTSPIHFFTTNHINIKTNNEEVFLQLRRSQVQSYQER